MHVRKSYTKGSQSDCSYLSMVHFYQIHDLFSKFIIFLMLQWLLIEIVLKQTNQIMRCKILKTTSLKKSEKKALRSCGITVIPFLTRK